MSTRAMVVRAPGSSANLGSGFDVFGMAVDLHVEVGTGPVPDGAVELDEHHPGRAAFSEMGATGPLWLRNTIPIARGLGFSGAVRVGAAALGAVLGGRTVADSTADVLRVATSLEGHGDNAAASLYGGVVANIDGRPLRLRVGPVMSAARVVAWVPDVTTSTERSRRALPSEVPLSAAVHNLGRAVQLAMAVERDDPDLLHGATDDRLHQEIRLALVPGAADALAAATSAGAWCSWLSGSGPTVAMLCPPDAVGDVVECLPESGHAKILAIDTVGTHVVDDG